MNSFPLSQDMLGVQSWLSSAGSHSAQTLLPKARAAVCRSWGPAPQPRLGRGPGSAVQAPGFQPELSRAALPPCSELCKILTFRKSFVRESSQCIAGRNAHLPFHTGSLAKCLKEDFLFVCLHLAAIQILFLSLGRRV